MMSRVLLICRVPPRERRWLDVVAVRGDRVVRSLVHGGRESVSRRSAEPGDVVDLDRQPCGTGGADAVQAPSSLVRGRMPRCSTQFLVERRSSACGSVPDAADQLGCDDAGESCRLTSRSAAPSSIQLLRLALRTGASSLRRESAPTTRRASGRLAGVLVADLTASVGQQPQHIDIGIDHHRRSPVDPVPIPGRLEWASGGVGLAYLPSRVRPVPRPTRFVDTSTTLPRRTARQTVVADVSADPTTDLDRPDPVRALTDVSSHRGEPGLVGAIPSHHPGSSRRRSSPRS